MFFLDEGKEDRLQELNNNDFIPTQIVNLTFWEKFEELQIRMLFISNENVQNHMYTSSPWDWLTLTRGIAYWVSPTSNVSHSPDFHHSTFLYHFPLFITGSDSPIGQCDDLVLCHHCTGWLLRTLGPVPAAQEAPVLRH